jgi:hypothetical protein
MNNIFQRLGMNYNETDVLFHVEHCQQGNSLRGKDEWLRLHRWLNYLIECNQKSRFFHDQKLREFIFINQWQNGFEKFRKELTLKDLLLVINSSIFRGNLLTKTKEIIKHIIRK